MKKILSLLLCLPLTLSTYTGFASAQTAAAVAETLGDCLAPGWEEAMACS